MVNMFIISRVPCESFIPCFNGMRLSVNSLTSFSRLRVEMVNA